MGYYEDLSPEDSQKVMSAYVGLKFNSKKPGQEVTQAKALGAFAQATGKTYDMRYARNPAVNMLFSLIKPKRRI